MARILATTAIFATTLLGTSAFNPSIPSNVAKPLRVTISAEVPFFANVEALPNGVAEKQEISSNQFDAKLEKKIKPKQPVQKSEKKAVHNDGIFTPVVLLSKKILGEEKLNKLRAQVISEHSNVISNFVDTSETAFGTQVLKQLFYLVDKDQSGTICANELREAVRALGFDWLKEKQIQGIFERADRDGNGAIDLEEWINEAPKTLRTNLIKLAKKNGGELGFLS